MARAESGDHCRREKRVGLTLETQEKRRDAGTASREEAHHGGRPSFPPLARSADARWPAAPETLLQMDDIMNFILIRD